MNPELYEIHDKNEYVTESMHRGIVTLSDEPFITIPFIGYIIGFVAMVVGAAIFPILDRQMDLRVRKPVDNDDIELVIEQ